MIFKNASKSSVQTYTCPLCNELGFSEAGFFNHVFSKHANPSDRGVLCPFCAVNNSGDPNKLNIDLSHHLRSDHRSALSNLGENTGTGSGKF